MLFLQENNKVIFVQMRQKKDRGLNFKIRVFTDPFNQITLIFIYVDFLKCLSLNYNLVYVGKKINRQLQSFPCTADILYCEFLLVPYLIFLWISTHSCHPHLFTCLFLSFMVLYFIFLWSLCWLFISILILIIACRPLTELCNGLTV